MTTGERLLEVHTSEGYPHRVDSDAAAFILDNAVRGLVRKGLVTGAEVSEAIAEATMYTVRHTKVINDDQFPHDGTFISTTLHSISQRMKLAIKNVEQPGRFRRTLVNVRRILNG